MTRETLGTLLLTVTGLSALAAVVTLIPHDSKMVSDLGYHTLCPFAPWSTLTMLFVAGLAWVVRSYIQTQPR